MSYNVVAFINLNVKVVLLLSWKSRVALTFVQKGVTCGAETANPPGGPESPRFFSGFVLFDI